MKKTKTESKAPQKRFFSRIEVNHHNFVTVMVCERCVMTIVMLINLVPSRSVVLFDRVSKAQSSTS